VSGFKTDLLTGLAVYFAGAGIGATWNTTGAYTALKTGIVLGVVPQAPDRVIALSAYDVSDDPKLSDSVIGVQIRTRWSGSDPRGVDDLDDAIFNLLHAKEGLTLSTHVFVVQCLRKSGTPLGQDANQRWSRSANYYVTVHRPSANRT